MKITDCMVSLSLSLSPLSPTLKKKFFIKFKVKVIKVIYDLRVFIRFSLNSSLDSEFDIRLNLIICLLSTEIQIISHKI